MSKRKSHLYNIYANPLPITLSRLSISNIIFGFDIKQDEIIVKFEDGIFKTLDKSSTACLWFNGFYGKGSLSRSEPTFAERTRRRLLLVHEPGMLTSEEVTKLRREERLEFKLKRLELESLENLYKIEKNVEKLKEVENLKTELILTQKTKKPIDQLFKQYYKPAAPRSEDEIIIHDEHYLNSLEYLQLLPSEVLFLSLINRIKVVERGYQFSFKELIDLIIPSITSKELLNFITYYHYKSLGWCVRSGVKFSTDYILYEKGPVFNHAHFAILIPDQPHNLDWIQINSIIRVVGGVKKKLILNFIECQDSKKLEELFAEVHEAVDEEDARKKFLDMLSMFNVNEVGLNRWSSTRNRE